jgi:hypothetical protein
MTRELPLIDSACTRLAGRGLAFIGGQGKSGTTWVERLVDSHPQAACLGEGHFAAGIGRAVQEAVEGYNRMLAANNARFRELEPFPGMEAADATELVRAALMLQFARILDRRPTAATVAVRTPSELSWITQLSAVFPDARFVHMLRDPRDVAVSLWWHGERLHPGSMPARHRDLASLAGEVVKQWARHVAHVRDSAARSGAALHELRYETLSAAPLETAAALFAFLGLDGAPATVSASLEAASFERLSGRRRGETDAGSHFRSGVAGAWREHLPPAPAGGWPVAVAATLESLGYPAE